VNHDAVSLDDRWRPHSGNWLVSSRKSYDGAGVSSLLFAFAPWIGRTLISEVAVGGAHFLSDQMRSSVAMTSASVSLIHF
jgi:hypothetical protein